MRRLLIFLVVVVLLLAGADRVAAHLAANEAEKRLSARGFTAPSVQVHGFPFLTQLARRDFNEVTVTARAAEVEGGRAEDLDAVLRDARVPSTSTVQIGQLTASGVVPYSQVTEAAGVPSLRLAPGPRGQVRLEATLPALGQEFAVAALAEVQASGNRIRVVPTGVELPGGGPLDASISRLLARRIAIDYRVPDLPQGLRIDRVTATTAGFRVQASGRNVELSQS